MTEEDEKKELAHQRKMEIYLKHLEKHMDKSRDRYEYAVKQFDTLMIAISTAGLGFIASYIKNMAGDLTLAYCAQIGFLICFFTNLLSHLASMRCNQNALLNAKEEFEVESYDSFAEDETGRVKYELTQNLRNREIAIFKLIIKTLNVASFLFLASSVICFIVFAKNN